jgi:hypothetical protein
LDVLVAADRHKLHRLTPRAALPRLARVMLAALAGFGGAPKAPASAGPLVLERTIGLPRLTIGGSPRHDRSGARTGLFSPESDRLYVAARATGGKPAEILVLRPGS